MTLQVGDLIPIGGSGNVKKNEVLEGKTYSSDEGVELVGEMPNNGTLSKTITTQGGIQKIEEGYYSGGEVKAQFNNLTAGNIRRGVSVGGIMGSYESNVKLSRVPFPKKTFSLNNGQERTEKYDLNLGGIPIMMVAGLLAGEYENDYIKNTLWTDYTLYPGNKSDLTTTNYGYTSSSGTTLTRIKVFGDGSGFEIYGKNTGPGAYHGVVGGYILVLTNPKYQ